MNSKYIILVLDIDETCVHTAHNNNIYENIIHRVNSNISTVSELKNRIYTLNIKTDKPRNSSNFMWGIKRPFLDNFLNYIFTSDRFIIVVWSAGIYEYVHEIVPKLFINTYEPHLILTRDNCIYQNGRYEKPFWKLLQDHPELEEYADYDPITKGFKNILLIDDRIYSFTSDPYNGILIPAYEPALNIENLKQEEDSLVKIIKFFDSDEFINAEDIRKIDKTKIFKN